MTGASKTSSTPGKGADWNQRAIDTLEEIQNGKMKLTDAPLAVTGDGVASFTNSNAATRSPTFTMDDDNW